MAVSIEAANMDLQSLAHPIVITLITAGTHLHERIILIPNSGPQSAHDRGGAPEDVCNILLHVRARYGDARLQCVTNDVIRAYILMEASCSRDCTLRTSSMRCT